MIPAKSGKKTWRVRGARAEMRRAFPRRLDHHRALIESVFSSVKRKLSARAPGRLLPLQRRQALLPGLSFNLYRLKHRYLLLRMSTEPASVKPPRIWYAGLLSRCDYSEVEEKGYNLVTLNSPELRPDLSDLDVEFRMSPTRRMIDVQAVYEDGELRLPEHLDLLTLKDSRVKVVVTVADGPDRLLGREQQEGLREKLLAASPAELKVKIEHDAGCWEHQRGLLR